VYIQALITLAVAFLLGLTLKAALAPRHRTAPSRASLLLLSALAPAGWLYHEEVEWGSKIGGVWRLRLGGSAGWLYHEEVEWSLRVA
jgi:hypothetical protein